MKIATLMHIDIPSPIKQAVGDELERLASPGTDISFFTTKNKRLGVSGDIDLTVPDVMELAVNAEQDNFDAIILGAM